MNIQNISVAGAVTYWKLGWANRRQLILESEDRGIRGSWVPAARAAIAVLKSLLDLHFGQKEDRIRPLKGRVGYEVVRETRGDDRNGYGHVVTITVENGIVERDDGQPDAVLQNQFHEYRDLLSNEALSGGLVRYVAALGGVPLRPSGAVYWIPEDRLAQWSQVSSAVEAATVVGEPSVYILRTQFDEALVRAVRDGVTSEVESKIGEREDDMNRTDLGERAFKGRIEMAREARQKLKRYERDLEVSLSTLSDRLVELETQAAQAAILASARAAAERKAS